jgi:hypothetical protein
MSFQPTRSAAFYDSENLKLLQRAFEGACWAVGIAPRRGPRDTVSTLKVRDALAKAVIGSAGYGSREVQALKVEALRSIAGDRASPDARRLF